MKEETHENVVEKIDSIIRANPWFHFHVFSFHQNTLVIAGDVDLTYHHSLEIIFEDVYFVSAVFQGWHSDTKDPVFIELTEERRVNLEYEIEEGNRVFTFIADDYRQKMIVAARTVRYSTDIVYYYCPPD
jgi:hypothetical protein